MPDARQALLQLGRGSEKVSGGLWKRNVVVGDLDGKIRVGSTVGEDAIVEAGKACVDLGGAGPRERRVGNGRS